ncbi:golgin subfamily B member 1 [Cyprinodon tularosa]|uniref:golgin subfamily B member 1 n=1 Tax=Cyprinodon tularosa TaxID=77115 RepID=UPI0018E20DCB|nr:golgin subfamily B member 1 [Cyprinodon tularosa]
MTSVEKRRSSRKSGGHRKQSDGGFSDTSSGGSFLDETDREVSSLTDRAFRSLCIGDEAIYNDSDLSLSSPSTNSDRQLAFGGEQEEKEREDRKRVAQKNFNLRMQQYGHEWITGGIYGAEIHRDPQWEAHGDRTLGMVSATFQHSLVETSQLDKSLRAEKLSFHSNGATELHSQQSRSNSRVSSLIRAFDTDRHRDGPGTDDMIREQNDEPSWDKSALMSIQRELSEFSCQQNFKSHNFHPAGSFSCRDANFCPSEAEKMAQISHSYMKSSQIKHSMSSQVNCSSNFFIHSEFSPFKLWRDYNRFPFQGAEASGFMHYSGFPKWYQTPMYNELSLEKQAGSHCREIRHPRSHLEYPRSISTSSQLQRPSAVEKRCESELAVHHHHRKWAQSLGTNKLPTHRPSTASPSTDMSRRVRDTISSVKALQQKVKMISEHEMSNQHGVFNSTESWIYSGNNALPVGTNVVSDNTVSSFRTGQLLTPSVQKHQDTDISHLQQYEVSPQPVEHAPVRAESRGATPEVRMSSYRSRASSLLFNLKDNRKRVKSTYSPNKFKGFDTLEKNQQPSIQEPHEITFTDSNIQCLQQEIPRRTNASVNKYHIPGLSLTSQTSHTASVNTGQDPENTEINYQASQMQGQMGYSSGLTNSMPSSYSNNQLLGIGQNPNQSLAAFTPYSQETYGSGEVKQPYSAMDTVRLSVDNNQRSLNNTTGRMSTKGENLKESKLDHKNVSLQDNWRQTSNQNTESNQIKTSVSPMRKKTWSFIDGSKQETLEGRETKQLTDANLIQNHKRITNQYDTGIKNLDFTSDKGINMLTADHIKQNIPVLNEKKQTKSDFEKENSALLIPGNAFTNTKANQVKDIPNVDITCEQVEEFHMKPQCFPAELAKPQQQAHEETPKKEQPGFILTGQTGLETIKLPKSEPIQLTNIKQVKEEHTNTFEKKDQYGNKLKNKWIRPNEDKQIEDEKELVQKPKDKSTNSTKKIPKMLKTEQAETEKLKQENIKTELAKTETPERVGANQVKYDQPISVQAEEKQRDTEKAEGEQMKEKKIKNEKVEEEQIRCEEKEQKDQSQTETLDMKQMDAEVLEVKTNQIKGEDVREAGDEKDLSHTCQINSELATSSTCNSEHTKVEIKGKLEQKESKLSKTEDLLERSAKLQAPQQDRQEPDRVEQVKSELAKAKAELAKIKEKMRGEQKEKVRNILFTDEESTLKNLDHIHTNTVSNADSKNQNHPIEMQIHAIPNDYERLREKYGFTQAVSANCTKMSVTENVLSNDVNKTEAESGNNSKSVNGPSLKNFILTSQTENKECVRSFGGNEDTGSQFQHNDALKKTQLLSSHSHQKNLKDKSNNAAEKLKENTAPKLEKINVFKDVAPLQKVSASVKHERNSIDQRTNSRLDMAVTPPRALSQKEKAQTKQEILTSKIKAHAEKEISAIKEKTLSLPEGFIGKSSTKHLANGQSANVQQRPFLQEVFKKQKNMASNKITPKHQVEPSEVQKEPTAFASSLSDDTAGRGDSADCLEEPTNQLTGTNVSKALNGHMEKEGNLIETSEKLLIEVKEETPSKTKEDLAQSTSLSKPVTVVDTKTKEAACSESGLIASLNKKEPSLSNDTVQIMGIMVTVVEREPMQSTGSLKDDVEKQTAAAKVDCNKPERGKENPSHKEAEEDKHTLVEHNRIKHMQEALTLEVIDKEVTAETTDLKLDAEHLRKRKPETMAVSSKDRLLDQTQHQREKFVEERKDATVEISKEKMSENSKDTKRKDDEKQQKMQKTLIGEVSHEKVNKAENNCPVKDDTTGEILSKAKCAPTQEDNICPSSSSSLFSFGSPSNNLVLNETKHVSQNLQSNEKHNAEHNKEDTSVHIGNIAIRVMPSGGKEDHVGMMEKSKIKTISSSKDSSYEQSQVATSSGERKAKISNTGSCSENSIPAKSEEIIEDNLEEKLAVQYVLSSVKKLSDTLKASDKQNKENTTKEHIETQGKKFDSSVQLIEADYFQVQGPEETSDMSQNKIRPENGLKEKDIQQLLPSKTMISNELHEDQRSDVFVFTVDQSERKANQSLLAKTQGENLTRKTMENEDNIVASKQTDGSMESRGDKKMEAEQSLTTTKHNEENRFDSSVKERHNLSNKHLRNTHFAKEKSEVKPKPKERVCAVPEISAIADYARLKVIVSEDKEDLQNQQLPPNKREGFFPLIQTRHSRCPVFTDDPQDRSMKTQSLPNKTEISATVDKKPKSVGFPIMEKEHQKTGMFKLGDKEKQEKLNAKMNISSLDKNKSAENQTDINKSTSAKTELLVQAAERHQMSAKEEQQQRKATHEEQRRATEEQQRMSEQEEQQRKITEEENIRQTEDEQQGRAAEEQQMKTEIEEQQRKLAEIKQRKREAHEQELKGVPFEEQRSIAEDQRKVERRRAAEEQQRRAAQEEQQRSIAENERERRAEWEQQKWAAQLEQQSGIAEEEQKRQAAHEEQRRAAQEHKRRAAQLEEQRRIAEEEQRRKAAYEEQKRAAWEQQRGAAQLEEHKIAEEAQRRKAAHEEKKRAAQEQQRGAAELEEQRRLAEQMQRRKAAYEEKKRAAQEQQRRAAQLEEQRRIAEEEQRRKAAHEEQKRAAQEQQRGAVELEEQRRIAEQKQRRKAAYEEKKRAAQEQQRRAAQLEKQMRIAEEQTRQAPHKEQERKTSEEQHKKLGEESQQTAAVQEELQRGAEEEQISLGQIIQMKEGAYEHHKGKTEQEHQRAAEKQLSRALQNEQQRKGIEEKQRRASQLKQSEKEHEQQLKTAEERRQRREAEQQEGVGQKDGQITVFPEEHKHRELYDQKTKSSHNEQQRTASEEQQRRAVQEENQKEDLEENWKRVAQEKQQRIPYLIEGKIQVKQVKEQTQAQIEMETKGKPRVDVNAGLISEKESIKQMQEHKMLYRIEETKNEGEKEKSGKLENDNKTAEKEKIMRENRVQKHVKESVKPQDFTPTKTEYDTDVEKMKGEKLTSPKDKAVDLPMEMGKRVSQNTDALQYYAITSNNREKTPRDRQLSPTSPLQNQNKKLQEPESSNNLLYHTRPHRPQAAVSPAPYLPRSNTSSPALGAKPLMFRVKDNTIRGSSFTKSVKPRFHKNFGEDFLMGLTLDGGSDKTGEDQEILRQNRGTPINRFAAINDSAAALLSSSQDNSNSLHHLRPYSRRGMAMDDDESRSVISNMSEDVESFATSAADLTDMQGLFDFDRPESACSFSSDISRSMGKPPAVPPKSEKALRRAQRLTSRRIKKELSKVAAESPLRVGKDDSSFPSSSQSSNEVCSSNYHAVASPHFTPPVAVALAPAPALGSSLHSSHKDHKSSHHSFHASPHATDPISIPSSLSHAGSAVSINGSSTASKPVALQTVAHVSSSPALHHVNHPATSVTQYHVESANYPQSYPLTQRKVLQDPGSGQYFVVDVPVQVKTKTFFDPETGKYVQLKVRQTGLNISQPQLQQTYQQPQIQPQIHIRQQKQPLSINSKPFSLYQHNNGTSQNYQTAVVNSVLPSNTSVLATQQVLRQNHSYGNPEVDQNSAGHRYSPEKTPYMDTVNDVTKTYNLANSKEDTCNPSIQCDSQLDKSSVCENDHSANSEYQSRHIIAISELEDFMEVSDW